MEREILFKAKVVDESRWVEGFYKKVKFYRDKKEVGEWIEVLMPKGIQNQSYLIEPETVCQFTGLLDSTGKKIFEGDILSNGIRDRIVVWTGIGWGLKAKDFDSIVIFDEDDYKELIVKGNIHD